MKIRNRLFAVALGAAYLAGAAQPWTQNPGSWSAADRNRILTDSPWAQTVRGSFALTEEDNEPPPPGPLPSAAEAGMAGPRGATDGHWDGGVGRMPRGGTPTLPIFIRWESASVVMLAQESGGASEPKKNYIVSVSGLVPAKRYQDKGELTRTSDSDRSAAGGPAQNPEELLEEFMQNAALAPRGKPALRPEDAKLEAATGTVRLFFPRATPIDLRDREVVFSVRYGQIRVVKVFRLKEMVVQKTLDL